MTKQTHLKRMLAILVSVALLASCISVAGWSVAAAETVWDLENEAVGDTNLSLYTGDSIKVSDAMNHTTGGGKSLKFETAQTAGGARAQLFIKDSTGNVVTVAKDEEVEVSFWVYVPAQEAFTNPGGNNQANTLRLWLTAGNGTTAYADGNAKNAEVIYEKTSTSGLESGIPADTWHKVSVTTNGAYAGKLRMGLCANLQGTKVTFYVDDITVTRDSSTPVPPPAVTGTSYSYKFDVNNGMYWNSAAQTAPYYGTVDNAANSHNNAIKNAVVETAVVANGSGYAMQLAYTGNLAQTADTQRYAIFSLPNYTGAKVNGRNPGQSIHLEMGSAFKITVKYKVTGYVSPATLYATTYNGSEGALSGDKTFSTDFADHAVITRIEGTTTDFETASVVHAPDMNNNLYILLKMDDDTNRNGTKVVISEITIEPVAAGTVRFDTTGGSAISSVSGAVGDTITMPADPTRAGYVFQGWMTADGSALPTVFAAGEVTLTARWLPSGAQVMDAEDLTVDTPIQLNTVANNTAAASTDYNLTKDGSKAIKVKGTLSSRERTQFFVKVDGNQVVLEQGKDYKLSFWYYIPATEGNYSLKYWFAAGNSTDPYSNSNDTVFFGERIAASDKTIDTPAKGVWTQVTVDVKDCDRPGNLRIGVCGSSTYTIYLDDITVYEVAPFVSDPNTMDFENAAIGTDYDISTRATQAIKVTDEYNHTALGAQSVKFTPVDQGGGTRPQMMVKDGTGAQVNVQAGKIYKFSFWLYLAADEGNYGISYWWAATDNETPFADGAAKNAALIHEAEVRSESIKGQWTEVTVTVESPKTGKLRLGICGSDSNSKTRTFYVDDIYVKETVPYTQDPDVETFERYNAGDVISIPNSTGCNTVTVSADKNDTENGAQSALVNTNTKAGGGRAQMLVKDGEGNQVMIEQDHTYIVSFKYFIPDSEPDYRVNFWLTAADSEAFYTASSEKDAVKLYERSDASGADTKGEWVTLTARINGAAHVGKLRIGFATNTNLDVKYYIDDLKVEDLGSVKPGAPTGGDVLTFENYLDGQGTELFLHGSGQISSEFNHTEGGKVSMEVKKLSNAGINRAQMVVLDPKTGQPIELKKGETYTFSMWVYKSSDYGPSLALNMWAMTTDTLTKINNKSTPPAEYDMGGPALWVEPDLWQEITFSFTVRNGKYLVLGLTDHSTQENQGIFYVDDIQLAPPKYITVKFDSNGSADTYDDVTAISGELVPFDAIDPYREGYEFTGWYTEKDCNVDSFFDILATPIVGEDGDVVQLYAGWKEWDGITDRIEFDEDEVIQREDKYVTEYYYEKVWVGDQNVPEPLDIGERPEAEMETITNDPVDGTDNKADSEGLPTWMIIVIIAAAVLVVGGGALAALLLSKKSKPTDENA